MLTLSPEYQLNPAIVQYSSIEDRVHSVPQKASPQAYLSPRAAVLPIAELLTLFPQNHPIIFPCCEFDRRPYRGPAFP